MGRLIRRLIGSVLGLAMIAWIITPGQVRA
jgi:hypothetical protein